jgi:glycosyltransferase involved in cell wall biosynthesis
MPARVARSLQVGIAPGTVSTPPVQDGHHRVWQEVTLQLEACGALTTGGRPDVWLYCGHGGDPGVEGSAVAVVYEVSWSVPGALDGYPAEFIGSIDRATADGVRRADAVITGSTSAKREVAQAYGYPPDRIHVVPFGVDPDRFQPSWKVQRGTVRTPGLPASRPYVLFINSLAPRKNVGVVRDAMEMLGADGYPHALVLVAGMPARLQAYDPDAERRAFAPLGGDDYRVFRLMGLSDDQLASVMAAATALCAPSWHEGFGLTVLEAMATGIPVVVSDRGSLPEVVGAAGVVVSPTASAVAGALRAIIDAPEAAASLGRAARRRAEEFTWERTAHGWLDVADAVHRRTGGR